jgi:tyrosine aminotransferase
LQPDRSWEVDLEHAATLVDEKTRLIVVNNPSNPCGSVYSKTHLQDIVKFAREHKLPIVADEIYGDIVFKGHEFVQIAAVSDDVPILSVGGISKQFVVPGWRLGWVAIHDLGNRFQAVRVALTKLSQLILGPNSLIQGALPGILHETKKEYLEGINVLLEKQAAYIVSRLSKIPGLRVIAPQGAMYVMVGRRLCRWLRCSTKSNAD